MALVDMNELLTSSKDSGRGVGAFNVVTIEHAEALVEGAERVGHPVVLQISQNCVTYHGALEPLARAVLAIASAATVGTVVHLDHADSLELIREAVELGIGSVMYDGSRLGDEDNARTTADLVAELAPRGIAVEAELGEVGGKDGVHAPGSRTDPDDAAGFVARTGVGSLAVAVGSSHAKAERDLRVDEEAVRSIAAAVPIPLVLHGSSSLDDTQLVAATRAGMTKINLATHLQRRFTDAVRDCLDGDRAMSDPRRYLGAGRAAMATESARLMALLAEAPLRAQ